MLEVEATSEALLGAGGKIAELAELLTPETARPSRDRFVEATIVTTSDSVRFLFCQLHEALADGYGQALLPALIEAALLGRTRPDPAPLAAIMGAGTAVEAGAGLDEALSGQLNEDGAGQRMQLCETAVRALDAARWRAFDRVARDQATTRFALGSALFALLLKRLAGSATPVWCASQRRRDARDFATLGSGAALIRLDLQADDDEPVAALAGRVISRLFQAIEQGDPALPPYDRPLYVFEIANEALDLEAIRPDLTLGEAVRWCRRLTSSVPVASLELSIHPPRGGEDGSIALTYDRGRYSGARAGALLEAYCALLDALAATPEAKAGELSLAGTYESLAAYPIPDGVDIGALADAPKNLVELYDAILRRWPDEPAAVWQEGRITFAELDAAVDRLSRLLRKEGAQANDLLAFRMSADAPAAARVLYLAAQLAAFRSGYVLLPLGQLLPAARAREEIERLGVKFVLSSADDLDCAPDWADRDCLLALPDFEGSTLLRRPDGRASEVALPDGAAVLLTTSGSTGVPKTIIDSQKMILGFVRGVAATGAMPALPGLMGPNIAFDMCFSDVWLSWVYGRWTVLLETQRRTPDVLAAAAALGAEALFLTPTVVAAALRDDPQCFDGFTRLMTGGEFVPPALVQRLCEVAPQLVVLNFYGSTETALASTLWHSAAPWASTATLGLALPGYLVVVADPDDMRPLPRHWPGELLLSCEPSALGYLDGQLTRERFAALACWPGERFFKTADLGWIDDSGQLRFVGRNDRQTKLSGVRIELDDVERVVQATAGVADAAAFVTEKSGQKRVEVVVEPVDPTPDSALEERIVQHCRKWLARAAIPSRIVFIGSMPLSDSGKKSHRALESLLEESTPANTGQDRPAVGTAAPRPGPTEAKLAAVWTRLFRSNGFDPGPMHAGSDVIDLGASSLDMLRAVARIERTFGVRFPDEQIYLRPTLSRQAALVEGLLKGGARPASDKPGTKRELLELVRQGDGSDQTWPTVIAVPGAHGRSSFLGPIGAHTFPRAELYRVAVDLPSASEADPGSVSELVEGIVEEILSKRLQDRSILVGYSFGSWLAWLTDRLLIAKGHGQRPVINLDGGAIHLRNRTLQRCVDRLSSQDPALPPSRMLLVHRAEPRKIALGNLAVREWIDLGQVTCSFIAVPTIDHADVSTPILSKPYRRTFAVSWRPFPTTGLAIPAATRWQRPDTRFSGSSPPRCRQRRRRYTPFCSPSAISRSALACGWHSCWSRWRRGTS